MVSLSRTWTLVLTVSLLGIVVADAGAQQPQEQERFQLKVGAFYDEGDFGTHQTTRTLYAPVTLKYLGNRFDVGVTTGYLRVDGPGNVTIIEGQPTASGGAGQRRVEDGISDTVLKGRLFAVDDPGPASPLPGLTPFAKVKFPTGDDSKNLGTGEFDGGFGLEFDKQLPLDFFLFGDASYTFIGSPPHQNLRDRPAASLGFGRRFTPALSASAFIEWRRSVVSRSSDPVEIGGIVSYRVTPTFTVNPLVTAGLTSGAPDFSIGFELAWKFGKY
jgi:outer membrane putative beta-barrel porin/alpha-amylase